MVNTSTPHTKPKPKADPSQIIITKAIPIQSRKNISVSNTNKEVIKPVPKSMSSAGKIPSGLLNRLGSRQDQLTRQIQLIQQIASKTVTSERPSISIRGRSKPTTPSPGLSMRSDAGLIILLICGLDRGTNSDDLKIVCEGFEHVLHCEVLRNRMGESFGEAEAAFDCVAKLDSVRADDGKGNTYVL
ncbi:hypothetical protein G6F56_011554 [Rhizopus delemar]|nr:hypothetical protein G6F56_011554 [Rhizopus delemar]